MKILEKYIYLLATLFNFKGENGMKDLHNLSTKCINYIEDVNGLK
jgi:hypothetical protein